MIRASALLGYKLGARDGEIGRVRDIYSRSACTTIMRKTPIGSVRCRL